MSDLGGPIWLWRLAGAFFVLGFIVCALLVLAVPAGLLLLVLHLVTR